MDTPTATPTSSTPLAPALEQFLDRIIAEKDFKLAALPDTFVEDAKADLRPLLLKSINLRLFSQLTDSDKKELENLVTENASDETLQTYFANHVPDIEQRMAEVLIEFRSSYLGR
ncbi:hypothetical protein A3B57_03140 [Microgenomates group bacterium RIFCSPLOWO2_01_FULL_47_10]|nr:MAG: hypothetical protein A3B57_03140 [Microgenomates group bacterium RIFCSPLOWO2_01_FULL_47_10]